MVLLRERKSRGIGIVEPCLPSRRKSRPAGRIGFTKLIWINAKTGTLAAK